MTPLSTVEDKVRSAIGFRLFTVLAWLPRRGVLRRVHSSHPEQYPVGGEKRAEVAGTWLARCVVEQSPYFGPDPAAVREIFADHRLIESLGCGSIINVPVVSGGTTLGVLNILDAQGHYDESSIAGALELAPLAVSALHREVQENRS